MIWPFFEIHISNIIRNPSKDSSFLRQDVQDETKKCSNASILIIFYFGAKLPPEQKSGHAMPHVAKLSNETDLFGLGLPQLG